MTGRYQAYPEYKSSPIDWLDEIPSHWNTTRLKYLGNAIIGLTYSPDDVVEKESKDATLVLRSSNVQNGKMSLFDNVYVNKEIPEKLRTQKDDILICSRNGSRALIGKNARIDESSANMTFGAFMTIFRSKYNEYLSHVFNSKLFEYQSGSFLTSTINQLTTGNLNSFEIPLPPEAELKPIISFLNHETAKIDKLISKQEKLIELLKEKRQAVISHAVTKGLNPDAELKDSGVAWLGKVPEHWVVCCLKHVKGKDKGSFVDGPFGSNLKSEHFVKNGDVYVVESNFATTGRLDFSKLKTISNSHFETISRSETREDCIIIAKIGARYGMNSILPLLDKKAVVSGNSLSLAVDAEKMDVKYCHHLLAHLKREGAMDDGVNVTAQPALSLGQLNNLPFLEPPLSEQSAIVDHVIEQEQYFSSLITKSEKMISLSKERKTALISAAVTGKIDVRNGQEKRELST